MTQQQTSRTEWPELLGTDGDEAVKTIKSAHPHLTVIKHHKDDIVTRDWREDRVRVFVDDSNKVHSVPKIG